MSGNESAQSNSTLDPETREEKEKEEKENNTRTSFRKYYLKYDRVTIPAMPTKMAVVCCVMNFIIPGSGTMLAGTTNFCCAKTEGLSMSDRCCSCMMGLLIGWAQLLTTACITGWLWSCIWGVFILEWSLDYYHDNKVDIRNPRKGQVVRLQPMSDDHTFTNIRRQRTEQGHMSVRKQPSSHSNGHMVQVVYGSV